MKIIVFDTETTGLPKIGFNAVPKPSDSANYPHIVQFSYVVFDTVANEVIKIYDNVVRIPEGVVITEGSIALHHITREIIEEKGVQVEGVLLDFLTDVAEADIVVGHNVQFDCNMVLMEMMRNVYVFGEELIDYFRNAGVFYCTMKRSVNLCAIKTCYKNSAKTYNKFPKLVELYEFLFHQRPTKLHNSLNDVVVCLRCFCKIYLSIDVAETSETVARMLQDIL